MIFLLILGCVLVVFVSIRHFLPFGLWFLLWSLLSHHLLPLCNGQNIHEPWRSYYWRTVGIQSGMVLCWVDIQHFADLGKCSRPVSIWHQSQMDKWWAASEPVSHWFSDFFRAYHELKSWAEQLSWTEVNSITLNNAYYLMSFEPNWKKILQHRWKWIWIAKGL